MFSWLWEVVQDPDKRAVISWLGGGIVVVTGWIWAVVRFVAERKKPDAGLVDLAKQLAADNSDLVRRLLEQARAGPQAPANIFINYRREDVAGDARGIYDGLTAAFGRSNVFMDVDNLLAGERFDKELDKALAQCDVLIAVMGPRWMELLAARAKSGERDYVREEIATALKRNIVVIPVRVGRVDSMPPLPRADNLPEDIRDLVLHQKHDVAHERFGRDIVDLVESIRLVRRKKRRPVPWGPIATGVPTLGLAAAVLVYLLPLLNRPNPTLTKGSDPGATRKAVAITKTGETFRDCPDVCPEMIVLPAGEFTMGSSESESGRSSAEGPQHKVRIAKPFAVGKYDVTVKEYEAFIASSGQVADGGGCNVWTAYGHRFEKDRSFRSPSFSQGPSHPVVCVSWQAATTYANWLTFQTHKKYRLLSEAEWEYAARASSTTRYFFGEDEAALCEYGNGADRTSAFLWGNHLCSDGVGVQTAEVGRYRPNAFGLYDMLGNAWEWVSDCWSTNYDGAPADGSPWMSGNCRERVIRGGSWDTGIEGLRSANRGSYGLQPKDNIGFRVARDLE